MPSRGDSSRRASASFPDEGRLEIRGRHLQGYARPLADSPAASSTPAHRATAELRRGHVHRPQAGDDSASNAPSPCLDRCRVDVPLVWLPAAGAAPLASGRKPRASHRPAPGAHRPRPPSPVRPPPSTSPAASAASRSHTPKPSRWSDCVQARCELGESGIQVLAISGAAATLSLRLRLAPHVFFRRGEALETAVTGAISVLALFDERRLGAAASPRRSDARRAEDGRAMWRRRPRSALDRQRRARRAPANRKGPRRRLSSSSACGEIEDAQVADHRLATGAGRLRHRCGPNLDARGAAAARHDRAAHASDGSTSSPRTARRWSGAGSAGDHARLVVLPIEDVYRVGATAAGTTIRGEAGAAGLVALRFGYRVDTLPARTRIDGSRRAFRSAAAPAARGQRAGAAQRLDGRLRAPSSS